MSHLGKIFTALILVFSATAFAENRAVVFGTTCSEYEKTMDDVDAFVIPAINELEPLKSAGWNVVPLLGGDSVWCDSSTSTNCRPSKIGNISRLLSKTSFGIAQVRPASKTNLLAVLNSALAGPNALNAGDKLLISVITHGNQQIFCSSDGYVAYDTIVPIFKKLKDKGVKLAFDADHCFSGGGVQKLSQYSCVVGISSATTTGLEGNPTLAEVLRFKSDPSMEDLFLARSVSYNSLLNMRQPEISGFTSGNHLNDVLSERFYPGDKNDLNNNTLIAKCSNEGWVGPSCDLIADAISQYQSILQPWELSANLRDRSHEFEALLKTYPDQNFSSAYHPQIEPLMDGQFFKQMSSLFSKFRDEAAELKVNRQNEKRGLELASQSSFPAFKFSAQNLAVPGTEGLLEDILKSLLNGYFKKAVDNSGQVRDPQQLARFFTQGTLRAIAREAGNEYYNTLIRYRDQLNAAALQKSMTDADSDLEPVTPPVELDQDDTRPDVWQQLVYDRLNMSIGLYFTQVKTSAREELIAFIVSYDHLLTRKIELQIKVHQDYSDFAYLFSGRVAYSLASAYLDYREKLSSSTRLTPAESTDKLLMESCANFSLRNH